MMVHGVALEVRGGEGHGRGNHEGRERVKGHYGLHCIEACLGKVECASLLFGRIRRAVFLGKMTFQLHALVQDTGDFDLTTGTEAVDDEMARRSHPSYGCCLHPIAAVAEMVGPDCRANLGPPLTSCAFRILGHVP